MQQYKYLFIDRDGTLINEPADQQVDSLEKISLQPNVIPALLALKTNGYKLVMISNQDGIGTTSFPENHFKIPQQFLLDLFASQGILFEDILICPHFAKDNCDCRKPKLGLVQSYLISQVIDREKSHVIGDRLSDMQLAANMGIQSIQFGQGDFTDWNAIVDALLFQSAKAVVNRKTKETDIKIEINLANARCVEIDTGIDYFDHMLAQLAKHGNFGLKAKVIGDLSVDDHHTVEDTAIALGQALKKALGDKIGIGRYGFLLPMDESLAQVALDICGRSTFNFQGVFSQEKVGALSTENVPHFFQSFAQSLGAALHIHITGSNTHHMIEAIFKAVGRALRQAIARVDSMLPTTKGIL